jgi:hypothetical protein
MSEIIKVKKMTKEAYLDHWNKTNGSQRATIEQVQKCDCGHCSGWVILKKEGHRGNKYK